MNEAQMLYLLDKGYTPEYVSLVKWQELRRQVMNGIAPQRALTGSLTCAMCRKYYKFADGCDKCPMSIHFKHCDNSNSIWKAINVYVMQIKPVPLHLITQMVNQLQYLVAEYGKYQTKP